MRFDFWAHIWCVSGFVLKIGCYIPRAEFSRNVVLEWCTYSTSFPDGAGLRVAPNFKDKTRYISYVSPGSQISHIATNKGIINKQCSIYNVLSIDNITLDSKQRKDNSDL